VQQIEEMAAEKGSNLDSAGLGLGPGRRHSTDSGTKRRTYLEENIAAAQITLSQAELDQIGLMLPPGIAAGPLPRHEHSESIGYYYGLAQLLHGSLGTHA